MRQQYKNFTTEEEKARVKELAAKGWTASSISKKLGMGIVTVKRYGFECEPTYITAEERTYRDLYNKNQQTDSDLSKVKVGQSITLTVQRVVHRPWQYGVTIPNAPDRVKTREYDLTGEVIYADHHKIIVKFSNFEKCTFTKADFLSKEVVIK